jgi:hypothetical protein
VRSSQFAGWATRLDVIGLERVIESVAVTADVADDGGCSYLRCTLAIVTRVLSGCFLDLFAPYVVKSV